MKTQSAQRLTVAPGELVHLLSAGELRVMEGRVWLTRAGDLDDHLLEAGQRIRLSAAQNAIIESWRPSDRAAVQWQPRPQALSALVLAEGLRGLATLAEGAERVLRAGARGFGALARTAASSARRAQGCISIGDSIASSGGVK